MKTTGKECPTPPLSGAVLTKSGVLVDPLCSLLLVPQHATQKRAVSIALSQKSPEPFSLMIVICDVKLLRTCSWSVDTSSYVCVLN